MKKQVVVIHGGDYQRPYEEFLADLRAMEVEPNDFKANNKDWKIRLQERLGNDFEVFNPRMPNQFYATYEVWKIWFEKLIPFLSDGVILIGHSLGSIFLVKYLSENMFPKKIGGLFLVAAPYMKSKTDKAGGFGFGDDLSLIPKQVKNIHLYHSTDDPIVEYHDVELFKNDLPNAKVMTFKDREHLWQEEFPEIVQDIRNLAQ